MGQGHLAVIIRILCSLVFFINQNEGAAKREAAMQKRLPEDFEYPCMENNLWRSKTPPKSVHKLRPGDIDVVAALGDSLTVATGAYSTNLYDVYFKENRGVSWSIGGEGTWRDILTVPNLLKVMNPNLVGYSMGDGNLYTKQTQFNMAFNGAMDQDLMQEARRLISKMKRDSRVDYKNHWKMLTLMIGTNDICSDQCYSRQQGTDMHRKNLLEVLDFLYDNMPKTFVNLVSMPYIPAYADLVDPPFPTCITMKLVACSCLFGGSSPVQKLETVKNMTRQFQLIQKEIAESGRYDRRDDFTVVFQPTNLNSRFPKLANKKNFNGVDPHDYSYIAIDCIHYTQKLHAVIANTFWNNLFEEPSKKTTTWIAPAYQIFRCPSMRKPFLLTSLNYQIDFGRKPTNDSRF